MLLIFGYLIGSFFGFRDQQFMVVEGFQQDVGNGTNLTLRVNSFADEYWPEGPPKDYRSDVVLLENGVERWSGPIRVNHPVSYGGVRIFQSFFGQAAVMEIRDPRGEVIYQDGIALGWQGEQGGYKRPLGKFEVPGTDLVAYVIAPAQGRTDPLIGAGQMRLEIYEGDFESRIAMRTLDPGQPVTLDGLEYTLVRERQFSGFQVSKDPGNMIIWVSCVLFTLGLVMVFYFPHKQVWARVFQTPTGATRVALRTTSKRSFGVAADFEVLVNHLSSALTGTDVKQPQE